MRSFFLTLAAVFAFAAPALAQTTNVPSSATVTNGTNQTGVIIENGRIISRTDGKPLQDLRNQIQPTTTRSNTMQPSTVPQQIPQQQNIQNNANVNAQQERMQNRYQNANQRMQQNSQTMNQRVQNANQRMQNRYPDANQVMQERLDRRNSRAPGLGTSSVR